ncbi:prolipoprotein diacylglyceryl transferase [Catenulispora sp. GP43]|uniref:prolipoprotein diacylglyceryl transferase n=1 Tax=Catenulispora sp. GP43 TaxID=3156263 RepID=UPI00351964D7
MSLTVAHQAATYLADIPSPTKAQYHLGPIPIRMYAMCILAGILVAVWLGDKRWRARGGKPQEVVDIAIWAVPFGLVGGRLYHVITTSAPYFGKDGDPVKAFYVWQGGLGIWGAIALGAVGAYIGCRRRGASLRTFADATAPGIVLAQALGRWGNWFNNELYGSHTSLPWGLNVHVMDTTTQTAVLGPDGKAELVAGGPFHPTFLYESIWCVGVAALCLWADRRFKLGHGRVFAVYVAAYTVGRFWIESLRIDDAHHFLGMRLNDWTAIIVFLGAVAYFVWSRRALPGRETTPYRTVAVAEDAGEEALTEGALVGEQAGEPEKLAEDSEPAAEEESEEPEESAERDESADPEASEEPGVAVIPAQDGKVSESSNP